MFKNSTNNNESIGRIEKLKIEQDRFINYKPGKKGNWEGKERIFGSQIVIQ